MCDILCGNSAEITSALLPHKRIEMIKFSSSNFALRKQNPNVKMKKILTLLILVGLLNVTRTFAEMKVSCTVNVENVSPDTLDCGNNPRPTDPRRESRIPARPVQCNISVENGVSFIGFNYEISAFEIYDCYGSCIASFNEERDFVETLFNLTGDFEVRFHTDGHLLRGFVTL